MNVKILNKAELYSFVRNLQPSMITGCLLSGDRLSCCDEAVGLEIDGQLVTMATIAPKGEEISGVPTIVAIYTLPKYRRRDYGKLVTEATIQHCLDRGFEKIRIDALASYVMRIIDQLPKELRSKLDVHDFKGVMDLLIQLER